MGYWDKVNVCYSEETTAADGAFVLFSAVLIALMQMGFGFVELACVSTKSRVNIFLKNLMDFLLSGFGWWIFGYAIASGSKLSLEWEDPLGFFFGLTFAATAGTIDSGALAERINFNSYQLLTFCIASFIYAGAAWAVWHDDGILSKMGYTDFAGGATIHMLGAASALASCALLGPRIGRFTDYKPWTHPNWLRVIRRSQDPEDYLAPPTGTEIVPVNDAVSLMIGTLYLTICWYGFNCGSVGRISGGADIVVGHVAVTTTLGAFGGGIPSVIYGRMFNQNANVNPGDVCLGILSGLVSVTAGAPYFTTTMSFIIGTIGSGLAFLTVRLLEAFHIDDVVLAIPVHGTAGFWGAVAIGFFGVEWKECDELVLVGLFYASANDLPTAWKTLRVQLAGTLLIFVWAAGTTWLVCALFNQFKPTRLRIDLEEELEGLDAAHGENASAVRDNVIDMLIHSIAEIAQHWDLSWMAQGKSSTSKSKQRLHRATSRTMEDLLSAFAKASQCIRDQNFRHRMEEEGDTEHFPVFLPIESFKVRIIQATLGRAAADLDDDEGDDDADTEKEKTTAASASKGKKMPSFLNPYVEVQFVRANRRTGQFVSQMQMGRRPRCTSTKRLTDQPTWNETLEFHNMGGEIADDLYFLLTVWDSGMVLRPGGRILGQIAFPCSPSAWRKRQVERKKSQNMDDALSGLHQRSTIKSAVHYQRLHQEARFKVIRKRDATTAAQDEKASSQDDDMSFSLQPSSRQNSRTLDDTDAPLKRCLEMLPCFRKGGDYQERPQTRGMLKFQVMFEPDEHTEKIAEEDERQRADRLAMMNRASGEQSEAAVEGLLGAAPSADTLRNRKVSIADGLVTEAFPLSKGSYRSGKGAAEMVRMASLLRDSEDHGTVPTGVLVKWTDSNGIPADLRSLSGAYEMAGRQDGRPYYAKPSRDGSMTWYLFWSVAREMWLLADVVGSTSPVAFSSREERDDDEEGQPAALSPDKAAQPWFVWNGHSGWDENTAFSVLPDPGVPRSRFEVPLPGAVPWGTYRPRPPSVSSLPPPPLPGGMKLNQEQKIQVTANQFSQTTAMLRKGARGTVETERERGNLSREGSQSLQQMVAQAISGDAGNGCETPHSAASQAPSPR
ncbi:unnamed protein product [Vitrella brassicaformis CCMP3155]|uniref:C2 domain-containing protein n=1 Tax=Vitrella brassicaformis (strain CCMP3155) TaxID=1169540 RepID=A0A0G4GYW5_VITBC|nr:unnamed protein product [Vitrella brassicaformis CCMP3155]|eukprot:CEM36130.1 unnamed protein product [Vitrella brassicaformis CCMP3155]